MTINLAELQADREAGGVTQADREAAWTYAGFHCLPDSQMRERWYSGYYDNLPEGAAIQAFARHRQQSLKATRLPDTEAALIEAVGVLGQLAEAVNGLIADSQGVYGLHLNGDPAPWDSLTVGGQFEDWLLPLEDARTLLAKLGAEA